MVTLQHFVYLACFALALAQNTARANGISLEERLEVLKATYPTQIQSITDNTLLFKNGTEITIDDGRKKTHQQTLKGADIEDMLTQIYPLGSCFDKKSHHNFEPGRIRNELFFRQIYGATRSKASTNQARVNWFGRKLKFTSINGADVALIAVQKDLAKLERRFTKFFKKTAGTFKWRVIAGTKRLSVHSFGAAIDLDIKHADYWRWSGGKPGNVPNYRNKIPHEVVELFERHGFIWGGKWYHFDTMHFEYRPELIALGKLALERGCPQNAQKTDQETDQ